MTNGNIEKENTQPIYKSGIVTNCVKLNVRRKPNVNSKIVTVLNKADKVKVDMDNSTDEFYAVTTLNLSKGFCMKNYITIQE